MKTIQRFLTVTVILPLICIGLTSLAHAQTPIQIMDCVGLQNMKNNLSGNYVLANDIDCANKSFSPIGNGLEFRGTLSGLSNDGKTIYKIMNLRSEGLFKTIQDAIIHDLKLTNMTTNSSGILADYAFDSRIYNISIEGTISDGAGVVNNFNRGVLENVSVKVTSTRFAVSPSGLVKSNSGTIRRCRADVNFLANGNGLVNDNQGIIENSYATGVISSGGNGMVYRNYGDASYPGKIINSYSSVRITNMPNYSSGLVFTQQNTASVVNSFWDTTLNSSTSAAGTGKTTAELKQKSTFVGWDFDNIWSIFDGIDYPKFKEDLDSKISLWNIFNELSRWKDELKTVSLPPEMAAKRSAINWADLDVATNVVTFSYPGGSYTIAINWSDLMVLSRPDDWSDQPVPVASVDWDNLNSLSRSGINWEDVHFISKIGINWRNVNPLVQLGVNWTGWQLATQTGINWTDVMVSSRVGIKWNTLTIQKKAGTNWSDWSVLSKVGINWTDVNFMTNVGTNWENIGPTNDHPVWNNVSQLSKKAVDWNLVSLLSKIDFDWTNASLVNNATRMDANNLAALRSVVAKEALPYETFVFTPCQVSNCGGFSQNRANLSGGGTVTVSQDGTVRVNVVLYGLQVAKRLELFLGTFGPSTFNGSKIGEFTTVPIVEELMGGYKMYSSVYEGIILTSGGTAYKVAPGTSVKSQFILNDPGVSSQFITKPRSQFTFAPCHITNCGNYTQNSATLFMSLGMVTVLDSGRVKIKLVGVRNSTTGQPVASKKFDVILGQFGSGGFSGSGIGTITTDAQGNYDGDIVTSANTPYTLSPGSVVTKNFILNDPGQRSEFVSTP